MILDKVIFLECWENFNFQFQHTFVEIYVVFILATNMQYAI
jgi:hypothetical protein